MSERNSRFPTPSPPFCPKLQRLAENSTDEGNRVAIPTVERRTRLPKMTTFLALSMDARRPTRIMLSAHLLLPRHVAERHMTEGL